MNAIEVMESARAEMQSMLDAAKEHPERNRLGQFATPFPLALDIVAHSRRFLPPNPCVRFLDPAFGTGAFYSALLQVFPRHEIAAAVGYEIDPHYGEDAGTLWKKTGLDLQIVDFSKSVPPGTPTERFNLLICNPPYVRHHHLSQKDKKRLQALSYASARIKLSGLSGLYCHFMAISHQWLAEDGLSVWLIPSEFMDVNYGQALKEYLLRRVTLLEIHRFDPREVQFDDALVSSVVVTFRNRRPPSDHVVRFTFGGSLAEPTHKQEIAVGDLLRSRKWTQFPHAEPQPPSSGSQPTLGGLFNIKRGLATGSNEFFVLSEEELVQKNLPREAFQPILPSPRHVGVDRILSDQDGVPTNCDRLFLLSCDLPPQVVQHRFPSLWSYLEDGKGRGVPERYLCAHRSPWYAQEKRPAPPILCTYMGRQKTDGRGPFRFILNESAATATNVYLLLYPRPALQSVLAERPEALEEIWRALQQLPVEALIGEGRVYGGGLHKMEPKELSNAPAHGVLQAMASAGVDTTPFTGAKTEPMRIVRVLEDFV